MENMKKSFKQATVPGLKSFHKVLGPSYSFMRKPQGGEIRTWQEILCLSEQ
jgi:hypothetical protein